MSNLRRRVVTSVLAQALAISGGGVAYAQSVQPPAPTMNSDPTAAVSPAPQPLVPSPGTGAGNASAPSSITMPVSDNSAAAVPTTALLSPQVVQWLIAHDATLTPLGSAHGVMGWVISKNGRQQIVYVTPDGKAIIAGVMAALNGNSGEAGDHLEDISALQVAAMTYGNAPSITKDPRQTSAPRPSTPAAPAAGASPTTGGTDPSTQLNIAEGGAAQVTAPYLSANPDAKPAGLSAQSLASGLASAHVFTVGAKGKPTLIMLADPDCPYCHASWSILKPLVDQGAIDVTVVLFDFLNGSRDDALSLLSNPDIAGAWMAGQGSVQGVAIAAGASSALDAAKVALTANEGFAASLTPPLSGTPTVLWVAGDATKDNLTVYRGTGLAGVGGFLSAVEQGHVATIN